jgi:hypothetical protein
MAVAYKQTINHEAGILTVSAQETVDNDVATIRLAAKTIACIFDSRTFTFYSDNEMNCLTKFVQECLLSRCSVSDTVCNLVCIYKGCWYLLFVQGVSTRRFFQTRTRSGNDYLYTLALVGSSPTLVLQ